MKSMIDENNVPNFSFFQIKKSILKLGYESNKTMICLIDIS